MGMAGLSQPVSIGSRTNQSQAQPVLCKLSAVRGTNPYANNNSNNSNNNNNNNNTHTTTAISCEDGDGDDDNDDDADNDDFYLSGLRPIWLRGLHLTASTKV